MTATARFARRVEPEWLDRLPAADARAQRSRRDLRRINAFMGNARIVARLLRERFPAVPPRTLLDLGAGDGRFTARVARQLPASWRGATVFLVDRIEPAAGAIDALSARGWSVRSMTADVFAWLASSSTAFDAILANLFLHHFEGARLAQLLALAAARTRVFVACEPRRSRFALGASRLVWALGCNAVTRHDATLSVAAGFRGTELSACWPRSGWSLEERPAGLFSHAFAAWRNGG